MFQELENQIYIGSDSTCVISDNLDISIDGSSKKFVWTDTSDGFVSIACTPIDLSDYEELSFHVYLSGALVEDDIFRVSVGGEDYNFNRGSYRASKWTHILVDCSTIGTVTGMNITSLIPDLTMFVDYIGVRKVGYDMDIDVIEALKAHINLDYDVATTLLASADAGALQISLTDKAYITDTSVLELENSGGIIETVELIDQDCNLSEALINNFIAGDEVRVICPIRSEDYDSLEPDPICGIKMFDAMANRREDVELMQGGFKVKEYLGYLGIMIYIDCSNKKKLLQLLREYNKKYGNEFSFLLDGAFVDIYMDSSIFADSTIGNNPRMAYYYRIEPQPYLMINSIASTANNLTVNSLEPQN